MPENHSAEWLRGYVYGLEAHNLTGRYAHLKQVRAELAEAEASVASVVQRVHDAVRSVKPTPNETTAAEVIAAAERALEAWKYYVKLVGDDSVVKANLIAYPRASVINADALAVIAKWKEAQ